MRSNRYAIAALLAAFSLLPPLAPASLTAQESESQQTTEEEKTEESASIPASTPPPLPPDAPEAADAPEQEETKAKAPLPTEQLEAAVQIDSITIPTPGELMAALGKEVTPNWQSQYRPPIPTTFSSRAQIALNVGGLIADGTIALEARDSQQIKNIGKDIITLAKSLAVGESVIARGNSIIDFADNNQWSTLQEELEATQNEVKLALEEQRDGDLITLVTLGGWIRGTAVLSSMIDENYSEPAARLLRQPAIVAYLRGKINTLPERIQSDKLVKTVNKRLGEIEALVSFPENATPTPEEVKTLKEAANRLVEEISTKEEK